MNSRRSRLAAAVGVLTTGALLLSACSGASTAASSSPSAQAGGVDLASVCPSTVVLQTDWNPEADHGPLYALLGSDRTIDTNKKSVSGPLMSQGKATGVNVEIRSGGPAIGFQSVTSQLYADPSIMLGYVSTDESILNSGKQPTTAVMAPSEKSPQIIMWDPATYPGVTTIKQLGEAMAKTGGVVRYFDGASYMSYLQSSGTLSKDRVDGSYDGTPANFVASGGKDGQQGFSTSEPYVYQHEVKNWNKPVAYQLINDAGYPIYQGALAGTPDSLTKNEKCLQKLVPVMQQAEVDFFANPSPTVDLVLELVDKFNNGWVYTKGTADYAVKTMIDEGIVANAPNGSLGAFDDARLTKLIDIVKPIAEQGGTKPKSDLVPADIATNTFIDTSIKLSK